jgi:hypothetical protein
MAGNISGLHVFTADAGPEALSLLDGNFSPLNVAVNNLNNFSNYYVDSSGSPNSIIVTTLGSQTVSYTAGLVLDVKVANTTTTSAPTINVNGLGNQPIQYANGNALVNAALVAGTIYRFIYDGANFRVQNPSNPYGVLARFKAATTSRALTTTLVNDPDLQVGLGIGTFRFELMLLTSGTTTTTQGFSFGVNFSGTFVAGASVANIVQNQASNIAYINSFVVVSAPGTAWEALPNLSTLITQFPTIITGVLTSTGGGILALSWAQNSSSANATNLGQGSYLTVTPLTG